MDLTKRVGLAIVIAAMAVVNSDFAYGQETDSETVPVPAEKPIKPSEKGVQAETGLAVYYHATFHGRRTASGESFDHNALTAAHKTLPSARWCGWSI